MLIKGSSSFLIRTHDLTWYQRRKRNSQKFTSFPRRISTSFSYLLLGRASYRLIAASASVNPRCRAASYRCRRRLASVPLCCPYLCQQPQWT